MLAGPKTGRHFFYPPVLRLKDEAYYLPAFFRAGKS
jgi:hypothetical protein